jgi:23S rRNA (guanosine2251-2'-O)-methyltransferase
MREWITSRNAALEILRLRSRDLFRLQIAKGVQASGKLNELIQLAGKNKIIPTQVDRRQLDAIDPNHQGIALEVSGYRYADLTDVSENAAARNEPLFVVLLDLIQNPQNLGTLIRSAEAAGVHGIIMPSARSAGVTPAVVHSSAGATEHLAVVQMNLAQAIDALHDQNVWVIGLDGGSDSVPIDPGRLGGKLAIVVGSEGEGMRPLTRKLCDEIVRLPMKGKIESLNAATAGSIVIYLSYLMNRQ